MHRSEQVPSRSQPSTSRSNQSPVYLSLISTKIDFLDTVLINRGSGRPLYATITERECTSVYAIDRSMELHKIVTINWGQGKKPNRTTLTNHANETVLLNDVSTPNQSAMDSLMGKQKQIERNYAYGRFSSRWTARHPESWYDSHYGIHYCYRKQPVAAPLDHEHSEPSTSASPLQSEKLFAVMVLSHLAGKPGITIDIHSRDLPQRIMHEDGFSDLDHVVLSALLLSATGGRKRGKEPEGWLNEAQLQEHLRAQRQIYRIRSNETLPLYRARPSMEVLPPAYASRASLQAITSSRP